MAHEVRNPLNAISLGVQRLDREIPPAVVGGQHRRMTTVIREEVDRLDGIVGRLLDLARPPRLNPGPGDLAALVREMLPLLSGGIPSTVRLVEELDTMPPAMFDPAAVRQVVHNLVRNSAEALPGKGTIRIATRVLGHNAVLEVTDDGPGIPPEHLERIFELGFSTKAKGNGLGLSIVHRLMTEMGGRIAIESQPGCGTTARLMLPFAALPTDS
jgi:signal transduction histidine kinase